VPPTPNVAQGDDSDDLGAQTIDSLCKAWSCTRSTVEDRILNGELQAFRVGRKILIPNSAIRDYVQRNAIRRHERVPKPTTLRPGRFGGRPPTDVIRDERGRPLHNEDGSYRLRRDEEVAG
jgi:excisionase family DNA binding protein